MANICENYLNLVGDENEVRRAVREWTGREHEDNYYAYRGSLSVDYLTLGNDEFEGWLESLCGGRADFIFLSKWVPPLYLFRDLSISYPSVRIMCRWEERGCDLYGFAIIISGVVRGINHEPFLTRSTSPNSGAVFDIRSEHVIGDTESVHWNTDGF